MTRRNELADHRTADKAIIAMVAITSDGSGHGTSRYDRPRFDALLRTWMEGRGGHKDEVLRCRYRVMKYREQLARSVHWTAIIDPAVNRNMMLQQCAPQIKKRIADMELYEYLRKGDEYGNW